MTPQKSPLGWLLTGQIRILWSLWAVLERVAGRASAPMHWRRTFLFVSPAVAQAVAEQLSGSIWDGCNSVVLARRDVRALALASDLAGGEWCEAGAATGRWPGSPDRLSELAAASFLAGFLSAVALRLVVAGHIAWLAVLTLLVWWIASPLARTELACQCMPHKRRERRSRWPLIALCFQVALIGGAAFGSLLPVLPALGLSLALGWMMLRAAKAYRS